MQKNKPATHGNSSIDALSSAPIGRRKLLQTSLGVAGAAVGAAAFGSGVARAQQCVVTPQQTEGPFYPLDFALGTDADLTLAEGRTAAARGDVIYVAGTVRDQNCTPVANALVEIWQAAASGRYNHPGDDSGLEPDPNFQGFGRVLTDSAGRYMFKTIVPGKYPAAQGWERPPHIHFKISRRGYQEMITQMYFAGDALNDRDRILRAIPAAERASVMVTLRPPQDGMDPRSRSCVFDVAIRRL